MEIKNLFNIFKNVYVFCLLLVLSTQSLFADNPNNPHAVWNDFPFNTALAFEVDTSTTRVIYGTTRSTVGGAFDLPAVALSDPTMYSFSPQVVIQTGGPSCVVAWISIPKTGPLAGQSFIYALSYQEPLGWMFPATLISDPTDDVLPDYQLSLALLAFGNMALAWRTRDTSNNVVIKIRSGTFPNTWDLTSQQLSP